jgi:hypothetical protein
MAPHQTDRPAEPSLGEPAGGGRVGRGASASFIDLGSGAPTDGGGGGVGNVHKLPSSAP